MLRTATAPLLLVSLATMAGLGAGCRGETPPSAPISNVAAPAPAAPPAPPPAAGGMAKTVVPEDQRPGAIDGKVVLNGDPSQAPGVRVGDKGAIPGISVVLQRDGKVLSTTQTDERGRFRFDALPAGKYAVVARGPGLPDAEREVDVEAGALTVVGLGFHADALAAPAPDSGGN